MLSHRRLWEGLVCWKGLLIVALIWMNMHSVEFNSYSVSEISTPFCNMITVTSFQRSWHFKKMIWPLILFLCPNHFAFSHDSPGVCSLHYKLESTLRVHASTRAAQSVFFSRKRTSVSTHVVIEAHAEWGDGCRDTQIDPVCEYEGFDQGWIVQNVQSDGFVTAEFMTILIHHVTVVQNMSITPFVGSLKVCMCVVDLLQSIILSI